jgi:hypothetical protein
MNNGVPRVLLPYSSLTWKPSTENLQCELCFKTCKDTRWQKASP